MKISIIFIIIIIQGFCLVANVKGQQTFLDNSLFRAVRRIFVSFAPAFQSLGFSKYYGKLQDEYPKSFPFFCDSKNGPGKRSIIRPTSIHKLTPGDIDIIAAMGDSMTAAHGATGTNLMDIGIENRGMSWSIGGSKNWRKYLTLPNILKKFNPKLYGYSEADGASTDRTSKFNVAEGGAMSRDIPYEAKVLLQRFKYDHKVNMTHDWKLLTILIGGNDFCSDICFYANPRDAIKLHKNDMLKTLRYLRDNVPRLMVNIVASANVSILYDLEGKPGQCFLSHMVECPCFIGENKKSIHIYQNIIEDWMVMDKEIIDRDEFNTNEFTVNFLPFTKHAELPKLKNGMNDYRYLSADCFHLSQRSHALTSIGVWNNLLEPEGTKNEGVNINIKVKCPTVVQPYIATRENSRNQN